jgi:hypothetical protein
VITAHFLDGPLFGQYHAVEGSPYEIMLPQVMTPAEHRETCSPECIALPTTKVRYRNTRRYAFRTVAGHPLWEYRVAL